MLKNWLLIFVINLDNFFLFSSYNFFFLCSADGKWRTQSTSLSLFLNSVLQWREMYMLHNLRYKHVVVQFSTDWKKSCQILSSTSNYAICYSDLVNSPTLSCVFLCWRIRYTLLFSQGPSIRIPAMYVHSLTS